MKLNKKGAGEEDIVKWVVIIGALAAILIIFAPKIVELLQTNLFGEKCETSNLNIDQATKQVKDFLKKNMDTEALLAYRDFKDCFKDKTIIFDQNEYEMLIGADLKEKVLSYEQWSELYKKYLQLYPNGKLAPRIQLLLADAEPQSITAKSLQDIIDTSKEENIVCEARFRIVIAKQTSGDKAGALQSLQILRGRYDTCKNYLPKEIQAEGLTYIDEWEMALKGQESERQKSIKEVDNARTAEELIILLDKYESVYNPISTWVSYKLGKIYFDNKDYDQARMYFEKAYNGKDYSLTEYNFDGPQFVKKHENFRESSLKWLIDISKIQNKKEDTMNYLKKYLTEYPFSNEYLSRFNEVMNIAINNKDTSTLSFLLEKIRQNIRKPDSGLSEDTLNSLNANSRLVESEITGVKEWSVNVKGRANQDWLHWFSKPFSATKSSRDQTKKSIFGNEIFIPISNVDNGKPVTSISSVDEIKLFIPQSFDCASGKTIISPELGSIVYCEVTNQYNQKIKIGFTFKGDYTSGTIQDPEKERGIFFGINYRII
jgi:tetratricopeptide (TPR) repeat protein